MSRVPAAVSALVVVASLASISLMTTQDIDIKPIARATPGERRELTGELELASDLSDYSAIVERPLFSPDRRKYSKPEPPAPSVEAAAPAAPEPAVKPPPPLLVGLSIGSDGPRALLRPQDGEEAQWVAEGATVSGWTIASIASDRVDLELDGEVAHLGLYPGLTGTAGISHVPR